MDKKLINKESIKSQKDNFLQYLNEKLSAEVNSFINEISKVSSIYVFSGVIRNYFIDYRDDIRDLDIVFNTDNFQQLNLILNKYHFKVNSFGGYKIEIGGINIDFWDINNTWALNNAKLYLDFEKHFFLPETSFFNFSSVVFDYQERDFIVSNYFIKFLQNRELDYVLEENPLPILCMVNTVYYAKKFDLKISKRLKKYYIKNFFNYSKRDFDNIQVKHFKEIVYPYEILENYNCIFRKKI